VAVVWNKKYTNAAGKWCRYELSDTFAGVYNNAGTITALGGSKFAITRLYASKDDLNSSCPTFFAVVDTAQYNNLSRANTAIARSQVAAASNELLELELVQLGYIIFSQSSSSIVQVTIAKSTFNTGVTQSGTNTASLINTVTTNFNSILSSADTNVQSALDTIDNFGVSPNATGDSGRVASTTSLTNVVNTTQGVGLLTILSTNGNSADNTGGGFIKIYIGTVAYYIPYFATIAP